MGSCPSASRRSTELCREVGSPEVHYTKSWEGVATKRMGRSPPPLPPTYSAASRDFRPHPAAFYPLSPRLRGERVGVRGGTDPGCGAAHLTLPSPARRAPPSPP